MKSGEPRECPSCRQTQASREFRGQSRKRITCRSCEEANSDARWCIDCDGWTATSEWYFDKAQGEPKGNRCRPCKVHRAHGVTRKFMQELTGSPTPQCSACGEPERLSIDHDHSHCPSESGCQHCVRGYLCRACNVAEGLLKTVERAEGLLEYMKTARLSPLELESLPPSSTGKRPARPPRRSATPHTYYSYTTATSDVA